MPKIWSNNITSFEYIALALGHNVNVTSKQTLSTEVHTQDKNDVQKRHTNEIRPSERTLTHFKKHVQKRNVPGKMPYVSLQSQPQNHVEIVCCSLFVKSVCCSLFLKSVCCSLLQAVAFCRSLFLCLTDIQKRPIYNTQERNGAIEEHFAACHSWQQRHTSALQHSATHCNTLQHTQHIAIHSSFMTPTSH